MSEPELSKRQKENIRIRDEEVHEIMSRINARRADLLQLDQAETEITLLISRIYSLYELLKIGGDLDVSD
jgi:hypothetical protein